MTSRPLRIVIAGWTGAGNVGDELLFDRVARSLRRLGAEPIAMSVDSSATSRLHAVETIDALSLPQVVQGLRAADGMVFGPGGLLQDTTSPFSLPGHLGRVVLAQRLGLSVIGFGLGAVPLVRRGSSRLVRQILRRSGPIVVRDRQSESVLRSAGVTRTIRSPDLAFSLFHDLQVDRGVEIEGHPDIALVPRLSRAGDTSGWWIETARMLIGSDGTVRLIGLDPRDGALLGTIRRALGSCSRIVAVDHHNIAQEIGACRGVISARYHGVIAAVLGGRPVVAVGFKPDITALVGQIGAGADLVSHDRSGLGASAAALEELMKRGVTTAEARDRLGAATVIGDRVLAAWLARIRTPIATGR